MKQCFQIPKKNRSYEALNFPISFFSFPNKFFCIYSIFFFSLFCTRRTRFSGQGDSGLCIPSPGKPSKALSHRSLSMLLLTTRNETLLWGSRSTLQFPVHNDSPQRGKRGTEKGSGIWGILGEAKAAEETWRPLGRRKNIMEPGNTLKATSTGTAASGLKFIRCQIQFLQPP